MEKFGAPLIYKKSKKNLIRPRSRLAMGNKMIVEGFRNYDQPEKYTSWKLGQTKPFFVSMAFTGETRIIGRSELLALHLPDDPDALEIVPIALSENNAGKVISMMVLSSMIVIILIFAYSIYQFKRAKKEDMIIPNFSESEQVSQQKLDTKQSETSEICNEIEGSPLKSDATKINARDKK